MSEWKRLESPKLRAPIELREMTASDAKERVWEVQELRTGAMFKVTLGAHLTRHHRGTRGPSDTAAEHAVCLSVEEALIEPPDKEPGTTYEVSVTEEELAEAESGQS